MATKRKDKEEGKKSLKLGHLDPMASEFISYLAHQIKSPLAAIKGYADLLEIGHYGALPEAALAIIQKIKASSERALDLSYNLLDLKRIEEGKMQYVFKDEDINPIVMRVCDELELAASKKKLKLIFKPLAGKAVASVDMKTLHQVIQNLVDNAIKYTEEGHVAVEVIDRGKNIVIKVADTGRGMSQDVIKVAFDKFTRDINLHQIIQGTGLGLFIAKSIVDAHKGKIWAESEGKGSQFYVSLPKA